MKQTIRTDEDTLRDFHGYAKALKDKNAFKKYVDDCIKRAKGDIGWEFLGFMDDYMNLAKIISKDLVVVDVGCAYGFQHIVFKNHKGYIGIDGCEFTRMPKTFTKNARFIKGKFRDVIWDKKLKITDNMFGIDNMSLLYSPDNELDVALFNILFKRKFAQ